MKVRDSHCLRFTRGFSLIELLTATAVFLLLTVIILQVVGQTSIFSASGNRMMEAAKSARTSLDTLAMDLTTAVAHHGATILATKDSTTGNTSFSFLCSARSDSSVSGQTSRMAAVFYAIKVRTDETIGGDVPMLCRGFQSLDWPDGIQGALTAIYNESQSANPSVAVDVLGESIFRMEAVFLLTDGTIVATPPVVPGFGTAQALDLSRVKGLIVAVATLDKKTQKLFLSQNANGVEQLAAALTPVVQDGQTPLDVWSGVNLTSFPLPVRQNTRFFQRTLYLP